MTVGSVVISERAPRRIGEILKTEGDGAMLRISVEGGGCSGFQYKFDIERAQAEDDLVIARDSAVVLVDPASVPFLAGSEVDFVDDLIGASFRVVNPNATASCGCGTSFSIWVKPQGRRKRFLRAVPAIQSKAVALLLGTLRFAHPKSAANDYRYTV